MMMTHVAGPVGPDQIQRCTRCGVPLTDQRTARELGVNVFALGAAELEAAINAKLVAPGIAPFPELALVDRSPGGAPLAPTQYVGPADRRTLCNPHLVPLEEFYARFQRALPGVWPRPGGERS